MNNFTSLVIVGWQTRNMYYHKKALVWCKDYGLTFVLPNLHIGRLYFKEERSLISKFKKSFTRKTDKIFFAKLCQSCYADISLDESVKQKLDTVLDFQLIQNSSPWEQKTINLKKSKKPNK